MQDGPVPLFALNDEDGFAESAKAASGLSDSRAPRQTRQQVEVEAKFTVPAGATLPDLAQVARLGSEVHSELCAFYFDTPHLALMHNGVALRRRSGGADAGWHLKVKTSKSQERREIHAPIVGARAPLVLREALPEPLREVPLLPVARMVTKRREIPLLSQKGTLLATVCVDEVAVELSPLDPSAHRGRSHSWKEVEVELAKGDQRVLTHLSRILRGAGFEPAPYGSKISRALERWPTFRGPGGAHEAVVRYAWDQIGVIQVCESEVAAGREEAVHRSRVAARRLRSTLSTFAALFPPALSQHLIAELRWYGLVLSGVRDAQVFRGRLGDQAGLGSAPSSEFDQLLFDAEASAITKAYADLHSPRYELLHDSMTELIDPLGPAATAIAPASDAMVFAALASPYAKTLRRMRRVISGDDDPGRVPSPRELSHWHRVRKAAKAVRYGYEALTPDGDAVTEAWRNVTSTLGSLQDHVVASRGARQLLTESTVMDPITRRRLERIEADEEGAIIEGIRGAYPAVASALGLSLAP